MRFTRTACLVAGALTTTALYAAGSDPLDERDQIRRHTLEEARRIADETSLILTAGSANDECSFVATLAMNATLSSLQGDLSLAMASCINEESGTITKFLNCVQEAFGEFNAGIDELNLVHVARLDLCAMTGGGVYDPDLDEDEFLDGVDHPFLPYAPGATWVYHQDTDEGLEVITVTVTDDTIEIDDIECIVVRDVVTLDGELIEDTLDWYAQHQDGTVWYMGEISQNFEDGQLVDLGGSWKAGEDGGQPGIVMMGVPVVGTTYRQELLLTEAEDAGSVLALDATADTPLGTFTDCLQTQDFTPLEPGNVEHKFYARGVGLVLETKPGSDERLELVSFTPGS